MRGDEFNTRENITACAKPAAPACRFPPAQTKRGPAVSPIPANRWFFGPAYSAASATGNTDTKVRPLKPLWKVTLPSDVAKMV